MRVVSVLFLHPFPSTKYKIENGPEDGEEDDQEDPDEFFIALEVVSKNTD